MDGQRANTKPSELLLSIGSLNCQIKLTFYLLIKNILFKDITHILPFHISTTLPVRVGKQCDHLAVHIFTPKNQLHILHISFPKILLSENIAIHFFFLIPKSVEPTTMAPRTVLFIVVILLSCSRLAKADCRNHGNLVP